jgi:hypothetical protein
MYMYRLKTMYVHVQIKNNESEKDSIHAPIPAIILICYSVEIALMNGNNCWNHSISHFWHERVPYVAGVSSIVD